MSLNVYLSALALSASQIVGIGPQNAFVIRQGIGRQHVLPIVLICIVCDVLLIAAGVLGMGRLVAALPGFVGVVTWAGAAFLLWLLLDVNSLAEPSWQRALNTGALVLIGLLLTPWRWLVTGLLLAMMIAQGGDQARGIAAGAFHPAANDHGRHHIGQRPKRLIRAAGNDIRRAANQHDRVKITRQVEG